MIFIYPHIIVTDSIYIYYVVCKILNYISSYHHIVGDNIPLDSNYMYTHPFYYIYIYLCIITYIYINPCYLKGGGDLHP